MHTYCNKLNFALEKYIHTKWHRGAWCLILIETSENTMSYDNALGNTKANLFPIQFLHISQSKFAIMHISVGCFWAVSKQQVNGIPQAGCCHVCPSNSPAYTNWLLFNLAEKERMVDMHNTSICYCTLQPMHRAWTSITIPYQDNRLAQHMLWFMSK